MAVTKKIPIRDLTQKEETFSGPSGLIGGPTLVPPIKLEKIAKVQKLGLLTLPKTSKRKAHKCDLPRRSNGFLSITMTSLGFASGVGLALGPLASLLKKLPLDKISILNFLPLPEGPQTLIAGGALALVGYLLGELIKPT